MNDSNFSNQSEAFPPEFYNDLALIQWIETNPDYADLVKEVDGIAVEETQEKNKLQPILSGIKDLFIADSKEYYGTAYVTPKVKGDAKVTALTVTASNNFDFLGNAPLFFFACQNLGNFPALFLSFAINLAILKFGNLIASSVVRGSQNAYQWSTWAAIMGLIPLNILQSFATGAGVELLNNRSQLNQIHAQTLIAEQVAEETENLENLKSVEHPRYQAVKERCEKGEAVLNRLERTNPRWDSLYVSLYGSWADRAQNWQQLALEKLPVCRQVSRLEEQAFMNYEQAKNRFEAKQLLKTEISNDLIFLQRAYPQTYEQAFTESGEIRSSLVLSQLALENFVGKLLRLDISSMGLSLFFFLLSVITSLVSCGKLMLYSRRSDVQMSWNDEIRTERDRWLEEQFRAYARRYYNQQHNNDQ
ncbi:hypothetical protein PCC7418_1341 [Halothece sp. PCC 7418]|uniref:hypothetical protein n=1 Tax=Halothece sp. (strain PCC 7418) TaxID=65093 RepID=UPI0002A06F43|nr:hypothetical protein [Halothece sp. PCC 7418]AFZ43539.1 hypothetical protein PCC7418_1341 [Halothece sp. PCC 7418]